MNLPSMALCAASSASRNAVLDMSNIPVDNTAMKPDHYLLESAISTLRGRVDEMANESKRLSHQGNHHSASYCSNYAGGINEALTLLEGLAYEAIQSYYETKDA